MLNTHILDAIERMSGIDCYLKTPAFLNLKVLEASKRLNLDFEVFKEKIETETLSEVELLQLIDCVTVPRTQMFRNRRLMEYIEKLLSKESEHQPLKVWSAACSSGEEAYSISFLSRSVGARSCDIWASDMSELRIQKALSKDLTSLKNDTPQGFYYCVGNVDESNFVEMKGDVSFFSHNLRKDVPEPYHNFFDVVICQNCLCYYRPDAKEEIIKNLLGSLRSPESVLIVSSTDLHGTNIDSKQIVRI